MRHKTLPEVTPTTDLPPEQLIARGYCRTSNNWCLVSRIDRTDWLEVLAIAMRRAPADFIVREGLNKGQPSPQWAAHYRSVYSKDTHTVSRSVIRQIPSSLEGPNEYLP